MEKIPENENQFVGSLIDEW